MCYAPVDTPELRICLSFNARYDNRGDCPTEARVEIIITAIFDEIAAALTRGDRVELRGFGAFTVKKRAARIGHNPLTGNTVSVGEKHMPVFKTGKQLRDRLLDPVSAR